MAGSSKVVALYSLEVEADEMWRVVGSKANKQWVWIALDVARQLWQKYREEATFYTDLYEPYVGVVPERQHQRVIKQSGLTNHIGAIAYFICHYNLSKNSTALLV